MPLEVKSEGLFYLICLVFILTMSLNLISSFCQRRTIVKIKTYLPPEDLERLMHAFVTSWLDCCNSVVHPEPAAVSKCDCMPLNGHKKEGLYYLCSTLLPLAPVCYKTDLGFKILLLAFQAVHGLKTTLFKQTDPCSYYSKSTKIFQSVVSGGARHSCLKLGVTGRLLQTSGTARRSRKRSSPQSWMF